MPEVALVTGASGFVGTHLVDDLLGRGWEVHVLGRESPRFGVWAAERPEVVPHLDPGFVTELADLVATVHPSACFHLASYFVAQHRSEDVAPLVASNLDFPMRLAEALTVVDGVAIVNVGTAWQHREGASYSPLDLYAATKQAFEDVLRFYVEDGRLKVVNLKLFDTYGPGDPRAKVFNLLLRALKQGAELQMSPGQQLIDLVHVRDVVAALHQALAAVAAGQVQSFAAGSGRPVTLRLLAQMFEEEAGAPLHVIWGGQPYRGLEMFDPWDAGPPPPGWSPDVDLRAGIREALALVNGQ